MQSGAILAFDGSQAKSFVQEAGALMEELGFDALWVPEHVLFFPDYDPRYPYSEDGRLRGDPKGVMDPFSVLTFLAATTSRIRLGTGICIVPQRHPAYLAKQVADLDRLSDGRFDFGVGVGWQREEYTALGIPFEERGKRMDEALEAMRALWTEDVTTYVGEFVELRRVWSHPKPVQQPSPPILVGGESTAALRRVATHGDGWYGFDLTPRELRGLSRDALGAARCRRRQPRRPPVDRLPRPGCQDVDGGPGFRGARRRADRRAGRRARPRLAANTRAEGARLDRLSASRER